jgi:hypothetical protein
LEDLYDPVNGVLSRRPQEAPLFLSLILPRLFQTPPPLHQCPAVPYLTATFQDIIPISGINRVTLTLSVPSALPAGQFVSEWYFILTLLGQSRHRVRKKLGLHKKKTNLQSYLFSLV